MNVTNEATNGSILNKIFTVNGIASYLKLNKRTVLKLIKLKELPAAQINRQYRITAADLNRFIESKKVM